MQSRPLADEIRPTTMDEIVGQTHILGQNGLLRRVIEGGSTPNMVFYGPSGTGKTTVANIIAHRTRRTLHRLNASTASIADIKDMISDVDTMLAPNGVLLYLDEIQYFNKKQQQSLLEFLENGKITLIASTTENPYFYVFHAILSRATVFEFKPVTAAEMLPALQRGVAALERRHGVEAMPEDGLLERIAAGCGGDVRKGLNALELLFAAGETHGGKVCLTLADGELVAQRNSQRYDRDGDGHYDLLSALQKSLRGSDADAGLYYLARLLEVGDLISVCRRLLVIAAEDIGLAHPQAISIVKSCVDSANMLGLPEARIPLAEAVVLLATAPKSNSAISGIDAALADVRTFAGAEIPAHLMDSHYSGAAKLGRGLTYRYPHSYPRHYVPQQYLPDKLADRQYYHYGDNKIEQAAKSYWDLIKSE